MKVRPAFKTQVFEEATAWFVDFAEGEVNTAGREAFNAWLRTSPEHVRAYLQISAFWEDASLLNKNGKAITDDLAARALAESNVVALAPTGAPAEAKVRIRRFKYFAAAASLVAAIATAVLWSQASVKQYATEIGEQRSLTLADGSTVELNARSQIAVDLRNDRRVVTLLKGQALFDVAQDAARPFIVRSDSVSVHAIGTQFDVQRKKDATVVTVVEGRVAIMDGDSSPPVELSAGQQATAQARAITPPRAASIAVATAWTRKKLVFESAPLREVIEEFNRYNARQLTLDDPQLAQFHISGIFPSSDPARLVTFLRRRFGVTVEESADAIHIAASDAPDKE